MLSDLLYSSLATLLMAVLGVAGCSSWRKTTWELGMGGFGMELLVAHLEERGPYLDVGLTGHGLNLRSFAPASDVCRSVLRPGAAVSYVERGVGGRFEREGQSCDAVGYGDPLIRGARQPSAGSLRSSPVPRAQATFRTIHEDADVVLLRGRFPLASKIGWAGGEDGSPLPRRPPGCSVRWNWTWSTTRAAAGIATCSSRTGVPGPRPPGRTCCCCRRGCGG